MSRKSQQEIASLSSQSLTKNKKYFTTQKITYLATMTVITLFLKTIGGVFSLGESLRITFVYCAWIISALTLGVVGGGIVGGISDLLCSLMLGWAINPLLTLSNILFPVIIGIIYKYTKIKSSAVRIILATIVATITCTLLLSSFALYKFYGLQINFWIYVATTRLIQVVVVIINLVLALAIYPMIKSLKLKGFY